MLAPSPLRRARNPRAASAFACALSFVAAVGVSAADAAEHTLMPSPKTVHIGYFLATVKPVLTIDSGDIVTIESAASVGPAVVDHVLRHHGSGAGSDLGPHQQRPARRPFRQHG